MIDNDLDTEKTLLGCLLLDNEQIDNCDRLKADHFSADSHKTLYTTIVGMHRIGMSVDITTLVSTLKTKGLLQEPITPAYILKLENFVFSTENAVDYQNILIEKYKKKELIKRCVETIEDAKTSDSVEDLISLHEKQINAISEESAQSGFSSVGDLVVDVIEEINDFKESGHSKGFVPSGFSELDKRTAGGLHNSDLIIIAARPSIGKTAFVLNMALNVGCAFYDRTKEKKPVAIFSLEMSKEQVASRIVSTMTDVPMNMIMEKNLNPIQLHRINDCARTLHDAPIYIDDEAGMTFTKLRRKARRLKSSVPELSLIVIDYLQLMESDDRKQSRQQEISNISRNLKQLARELNVPVVALSQLSREIEKRKGKNARPMLSDLRESGAIEQDADMVLFLHRDKKSHTKFDDISENIEMAELIIGKQRNGPIGTIDMIFLKETATYKCIRRNV